MNYITKARNCITHSAPIVPIFTAIYKNNNLKLYIKYMVSTRCKMVVKDELKRFGLHFVVLDLGVVEIMETLDPIQLRELGAALMRSGLELMDDKNAILIERIRNVIVEMIHYDDEMPRVKFSEYISQKLNYDYTYLANLFSEMTGSTIEHQIIAHKIEKVKELMLYDELNLTQISYKMNYSSVAHLSNQFKKVVGLSPSQFKLLKNKLRQPLEDIGDDKTSHN